MALIDPLIGALIALAALIGVLLFWMQRDKTPIMMNWAREKVRRLIETCGG